MMTYLGRVVGHVCDPLLVKTRAAQRVIQLVQGFIIACMSGLYSDTHPKMEALQIELWRQASPTRKMHMLAQLNASARMVALAGLRSRFPNASDRELHRRLAGLLLGEDLARKVYGEIDYAE